MDRLREWLNTTIQRELCNGLKWLESKSSDPNHANSTSFEDDGSNLRVKNCRPRVVQIIKVEDSIRHQLILIMALIFTLSIGCNF